MKNTIYLGLGSNIGSRAENIISALSLLQSSGYVDIKKASSFYETSPIGPKQRNFYNAVIKAKTNLNPNDFLSFIKEAEEIIGRVKTLYWGPRIIDIDILFFNNDIISEKHLTIPHKEIQNRLFVLIPFAEIAKNFFHPILKQKIGYILKGKINNESTKIPKYKKKLEINKNLTIR
jgi:2-amino-4-hydroxy-6-hydroxymethyldihydropteridine diphosphokinase